MKHQCRKNVNNLKQNRHEAECEICTFLLVLIYLQFLLSMSELFNRLWEGIYIFSILNVFEKLRFFVWNLSKSALRARPCRARMKPSMPGVLY